MDADRIEVSLLEKRQHVENWLEQSSSAEKENCLAHQAESCVQPHLAVIETSLEKIKDHSLGYCHICQGAIEPYLMALDYTSSICLDCMADEDKRALERELELSRRFQNAMLSGDLPTIPGAELSIFSRPAQVFSGDYFDVIRFRNGSFGLVVADAMGHGLSASFVMTCLQTAFRTLCMDSDILEEILTRIHRLLLHNVNFTIFATAFVGRYDPATRYFTYSNAGHNPPILYHNQTSTVNLLSPTGPAIGIIEDYAIQSNTLQLSPGDVVLFYSDGASEASNPQGEGFGPERLVDLVLQHADLNPLALIQQIKQELYHFSEGHAIEDDITLAAFKIDSGT